MDAFDLEFKEVVGKGSFGTVYRAVLRRTGGFRKDVAVKVLHDRWIADRVITARLRDEARVLGLLRHRALPTAEGLFWVADHPALVTEFVDGVTLTQLRARRPVPLTVALELCAEVANALHVAWHTTGPDGRPLHLVHRDIKPSNLQVTRAGEVKLLDFGVARADFDGREAETHNHLVGSLSYMSPERLDFVHGPEGDVYSLGVVLAEVLLGRRPERTSADRARHQAFLASLGEQLAALHQETSSSGVVDLIRDLLAYEAGDRPAAREVERRCRDLRRSLRGPDLVDWAEAAVGEAHTLRPTVDEPSTLALTGTTLPAVIRREAPPEPAEAPLVPPAPVASAPESAAPPPAAPPAAPASRPPAAPRTGPPTGVWLGLLGGLLLALLVAVTGLGVVVGGAGATLGRAGDEAAPAAAPPVASDAPRPTDAAPAGPPEGEASAATIAAPPPAPAPAAGPSPAPAPSGRPAPAPASGAPAPPPASGPAAAAPKSAAGRPVSAAAFAAFLASNPEWMRDEAIARKRAGDSYLQGWRGATPPAGAQHALHVSFFAAEAYCAARGGLAALDAAPATWPEGSGPFQEWRGAPKGGAAWRRFDGVVSTAVRRTDANGFTGFRCVR
jgi:tRNA A-37 threonylcarbamoyl transferase component Bud32